VDDVILAKRGQWSTIRDEVMFRRDRQMTALEAKFAVSNYLVVDNFSGPGSETDRCVYVLSYDSFYLNIQAVV